MLTRHELMLILSTKLLIVSESWRLLKCETEVSVF